MYVGILIYSIGRKCCVKMSLALSYTLKKSYCFIFVTSCWLVTMIQKYVYVHYDFQYHMTFRWIYKKSETLFFS